MSKPIVVAVSQLLPGDYVVPAKATVESIQRLGPITIVDFTDKTATPPVPSNAAVEIIRKKAA